MPMLDFILCVDDAKLWHEKNLKLNPNHYSKFSSLIGPRRIAQMQDDFGAKIFYNTLVTVPMGPYEGRLMKYGVISKLNLILDLSKWKWLYAAGRMHKPVLEIQRPKCKQLNEAKKTNLKLAVMTSLLFLPEKFSEKELYLKIAELSYKGDVRMGLAENPHKISNIVNFGLERFRDLYSETLKEIENLHLRRTSGGCLTFEQDKSSKGKMEMINQLTQFSLEKRDALKDSVKVGKEKDVLASMLRKIVSHSSRSQSLKGFFTAGPLKSIKYVKEKVKKSMPQNNYLND